MVQKQLRVALVDDEMSFLDHCSTLLDQSEYFDVVITALDAEDLLKTIPNNLLDVVVIDVTMPKLNGFSVSRQLLAQQPELTIVMVSNSDSHHFVTLSKDIGVAAFLPKQSFSVEALRLITHVT